MSYIRGLVEHLRHTDGRPAPGAEGLGSAAGGGPVLIRLARDGDRSRLADLAGLDSARPVAEPALVALVGDEAWAAVSLHDGRVVADPFRSTAAAVTLLRVRAAQLSGSPAGERAGVRRRGVWRRARA